MHLEWYIFTSFLNINKVPLQRLIDANAVKFPIRILERRCISCHKTRAIARAPAFLRIVPLLPSPLAAYINFGDE